MSRDWSMRAARAMVRSEQRRAAYENRHRVGPNGSRHIYHTLAILAQLRKNPTNQNLIKRFDSAWNALTPEELRWMRQHQQNTLA